MALLLAVLISAIAYWLAVPNQRTSPHPATHALDVSTDAIKNGEEVASSPPGLAPSSLEIFAAGPTNPIKMGERVSVGFWLKNPGRTSVWVVRSLDGSCFGRYPKCVLEIWDETGRHEFPDVPPGCGTLNPLIEADFIHLGPQQVHPKALGTMVGWWKPSHPGVYSIRMTYDTTGNLIQLWAGSTRTLSTRLRELLRLVPKGRFVSDIMKVSIVN